MGVNGMMFSGTPTESPEQSMTIDQIPKDEPQIPLAPFPDCIIPLSEEQENRMKDFLDRWIVSMKQSHDEKEREWIVQERQYRARSDGPQNTPFVGACGDNVPVSAMAIDPIHARLDTGIFKPSPVFVLKPLKKSIKDTTESLEAWIEYYQKHRLNLRQVVSPRLLEMTKHGTMVLKTVYHHESYKVKGYDKSWKVVDKEVTSFKGPKVFGINLVDFLCPPNYQHLQDCPIVAERQRWSVDDLYIAQASGQLTNVKDISRWQSVRRDMLEQERQESAQHTETINEKTGLIDDIYECWFDFNVDGNGTPQKWCVTYHLPTRTFLQRRYNWYFHQKKPYTLIPYSVTNDSLYGLGIGEMSMFFQDAATKWHRMATDNTYLANIRMYIAKKESGIEEVPKLYAGRTFFVDEPAKDFIPFQAADIYPSTLTERQNIFGLAEKRTGVSDYLTGRESPVIGSRATATSTVALIQEGTKRVEEVLDNVRVGLGEVMMFCIYIWIQYGLDGLEDVVFGSDKIATDVKTFFDNVSDINVDGAIAIDLSATDAANNKSVQQQVQLAIIQTMMQYLDKLVQAGQLAIQAAQAEPNLTALVSDVMEAARKLFRDLLQKYDIRNPDEYLPDLQKYLNAAAQGQGVPPASVGYAGGPEGEQSLPAVSGASFAPPVTSAPGVGGSNGLASRVPTPGVPGSLS
jgi:hypothetical protein